MNWKNNEFEDDDSDYTADHEIEPTVPCPECKAEIHEDSPRCPFCGSYVTITHRVWSHKPAWLRRVATVLLILALAGFVAIELRHWLGIRLVQPGEPTGTLRVRE